MRINVKLSGGPFDGASREIRADPPRLVWATEDETGVRLFRRRAPGRVPYLARDIRPPCPADAIVEMDFDYGGATHVVCPGCGVYHARVDSEGQRVVRCDLCDHELPRNHA